MKPNYEPVLVQLPELDIVKRRDFLKITAASLSVSALSACGGSSGSASTNTQNHPPTQAPVNPPMPDYTGPNPFRHGVASGDPLPHQAIFWTRISAPGLDEIPVILRVYTDYALTALVYEGVEYARSQQDFTVKFDPLLPHANTTYYYQFESLHYVSPIGRTKTIPEAQAAVEHARFAVLSCSNYPQGYFNVYRQVAKRPDLDLVIHLGDYIYEYAQGEYADAQLTNERPVDPPHAIVSLGDYRRRYALYRSDDDLQECHRQHPFICIWDDHEIANDTWREGAENHSPEQGDFAARKRAAIQAYHEWMPIRRTMPDEYTEIYRSFDYGQLLSLIMLDTRVVGAINKPPFRTKHVIQSGSCSVKNKKSGFSMNSNVPMGAVHSGTYWANR